MPQRQQIHLLLHDDMAVHCKIDGTWRSITKFFKKQSGTWGEISENNFIQYCNSHVYEYGGHIHSDVEHVSLSIAGPSTIEGASSQLAALCDGTIDVTTSASWSITNGASYASISNSGILTISSNANNSIVTVQAVYEGLTATTNVTVTYKAGITAQTETIVETDEHGNTTVTTTTENSDGSSSSVSTHYDSNGNETGHENEVTDTEGNTSVQTIQKDNNGNDVVTGYDIDTTNNNNGGLEISSGLDTGVLVFDGHDWTATLKAEILFSDITPASTQFPLMNVSSRGDDNKLDGAFLLVTRQTSGMGSAVYDENGTQQSTTTSSNPTMKWRIQHYLGGSLQNGIDFYYKNGTRPYYTNRFGSKSSAITLTYKMSYTESNHQLVTEIYDSSGANILAKPRSEAVITFTKTMSDITFELGQATNVSGVELKTKLEIIDFHVEKTL